MRHQNSVFHQVLKHIPWKRFDELVDEHHADKHVRQLSSKSQLVAMLYAQFSGASSLREITGGLQSHSARLYHVGARPVQRSTLADANAKRPSAVFSELFNEMVCIAGRGLRRKIGEATYLIDSTGIRLSGTGSGWAHFSHMFFGAVRGAKAHVIYDADAQHPIYAAVTPARINDITAAQEMPIEEGATYVFDLGYYDFNWWHELDQAGCRIVTRFKSNASLTTTAELEVPEGTNILSDRIGLLARSRKKNLKNLFVDPVREVCIKADNGKVLRLMCNDLDASAEEIADLYKRRWAIELFFRWIKQTLKIRHFIGVSENAVRIQVAVALIAYMLLHLAQKTQNSIKSPLAFARLVRVNIMHKKRIDRLLEPEPDPGICNNQMALQWL